MPLILLGFGCPVASPVDCTPEDVVTFSPTTPSSHTKYDTNQKLGHPYLWVAKQAH